MDFFDSPLLLLFQDLGEKASCTRVGPFGEPYNVMIMGRLELTFTEILPSATKCMGSPAVVVFFPLTNNVGGNVIMRRNVLLTKRFLTFDISDITNFS